MTISYKSSSKCAKLESFSKPKDRNIMIEKIIFEGDINNEGYTVKDLQHLLIDRWGEMAHYREIEESIITINKKYVTLHGFQSIININGEERDKKTVWRWRKTKK